jgi:hypothetical protein
VDRPKLVTFFDLLQDSRNPCTPAHLATATEKHGVWGWDRFGRYGNFKPGSDGALSALHALAEFQKLIDLAFERADQEVARLEQGDPYPCLEDPLDWVFDQPHTIGIHRFGWPKAAMPPIDLSVKHPPPPPKKHTDRGDTATMNRMGALLLVLEDLRRDDKLMKIPSEAQLIKKIEDKFPNLDGCGKSTLEGKFADAKRAVKQS